MNRVLNNEDASRFFENDFDPSAATVWEPDGIPQLLGAVHERTIAQTKVDNAVIEGRRLGLTWPQIAAALGVSPQAARQRYKGIVDASLAIT